MLPAPYPPKPHREPDFIPSIPNPTGAADNWQNLRPPPSLGFPSSRMRAAGGGRRKRRRKKKRRRAGAARPCAVPAGERWAAPQSAHAGLCARTSRPRNRRSPSPETFHHLSPQSRAEQSRPSTRPASPGYFYLQFFLISPHGFLDLGASFLRGAQGRSIPASPLCDPPELPPSPPIYSALPL